MRQSVRTALPTRLRVFVAVSLPAVVAALSFFLASSAAPPTDAPPTLIAAIGTGVGLPDASERQQVFAASDIESVPDPETDAVTVEHPDVSATSVPTETTVFGAATGWWRSLWDQPLTAVVALPDDSELFSNGLTVEYRGGVVSVGDGDRRVMSDGEWVAATPEAFAATFSGFGSGVGVVVDHLLEGKTAVLLDDGYRTVSTPDDVAMVDVSSFARSLAVALRAVEEAEIIIHDSGTDVSASGTWDDVLLGGAGGSRASSGFAVAPDRSAATFDTGTRTVVLAPAPELKTLGITTQIAPNVPQMPSWDSVDASHVVDVVWSLNGPIVFDAHRATLRDAALQVAEEANNAPVLVNEAAIADAASALEESLKAQRVDVDSRWDRTVLTVRDDRGRRFSMFVCPSDGMAVPSSSHCDTLGRR